MKSKSILPGLLLLTVVLGVAVAVYLVRAWNAGPEDGDDPPVAIVNDHPIRESYVRARINEATLGEQIALREQRERFVNSLILEEMLLQSMLSNDFADEPELRDQVKSLVAEHLIRRHVGERIEVREADAKAYYASNQSVIRGETVSVSHIVLGARAECERLMATIRTADDFENAARTHSLHPETGPRGGALGRVMNHNGALGFEQDMFQMRDGEMRVFDASDGCHLVRAGEREVPPVPPYEQVRERIHALLRRQQEINLLRELDMRLRARIEVERRPR